MNAVAEFKGTPGPWESEEFGIRATDGPTSFRIHSPRAGGIALTVGYSAVDEANASLMTAAHDLLELANRVEWLLAQEPYPYRRQDELAILGEARAAIAKELTGGEPAMKG